MERHFPYTIRPFSMEAYDEVYALWQATPGVGLSSADGRDEIGRYLARNPGLSFVAEQDGRLVGAVLCGHDGRRGFIHHLAVRPEARRQGLGGRLVRACLGGLRAAGIQKCHLFVFGANVEAIAFWKAAGWVSRDELVLMSMNLGGGAGF
jgi:putative acetyltransferase